MLTIYQACGLGLFALSVRKCKTPAKNDSHRLKDGTYFTKFRRVQKVFRAYLMINNYFLECFKIDRP